ncbi:helix-turn-helix domain-containing protein [Nonomuraea sp. B19D2]|uniref:helix-turn-helix domain-containing protein n=1 Tax=Nonomuraea sp. B19D2 TaxID=3159561 RepID=UPI0032DACB67
MATYARVDRSQVVAMLRDGEKYGVIAAALGCSYRTVAGIAKEAGLSRTQADHKEALPWTLEERHKLSMPAQRLRDLSRLAQGLPVDVHRKIGALRWAQYLVDEGWDVAYDPDHGPSPICPDGGFYTIEATTTAGKTHIGALLAKATGKPVRRSARR